MKKRKKRKKKKIGGRKGIRKGEVFSNINNKRKKKEKVHIHFWSFLFKERHKDAHMIRDDDNSYTKKGTRITRKKKQENPANDQLQMHIIIIIIIQEYLKRRDGRRRLMRIFHWCW